MSVVKLYNLAKVTTPTVGTGSTITLGPQVSGYLTFANAGVSDGETIFYGIRDGANSEVGTGTYTASGTTLTRTVIKSTNSDARISLSGLAEVYIAVLAAATGGQLRIAGLLSQIDTVPEMDYGAIPNIAFACTDPYVDGGLALLAYNNVSTDGATLYLSRSLGTTIGDNQPIISGSFLGSIHFMGYNTNGYAIGASIQSYVDDASGAIGATVVPGALSFNTCTNGPTLDDNYAVTRMVISSAGEISVGRYPSTFAVQGSFVPIFQVNAWLDDTTHKGDIGQLRWNDDTIGARTFFAKSNSDTIGTQAAVVAGQNIMELRSAGSDGTQFINGGMISSTVDGTVSTGKVPVRFGIWTAPAATGTLTERQRIDSDGNKIYYGDNTGSSWESSLDEFNYYNSLTLQSLDVSSGTYLADIYDSTGSLNLGFLRMRIDDTTGGSVDTSWHFGNMIAGATTTTLILTTTANFFVPFGYGTSGSGVGGTVVQPTSKTTGVTLNTVCGVIITSNATLNAGSSVVFEVSNNKITTGFEVVPVSIQTAGTSGAYVASTRRILSSGTFGILLQNISASNLAEAVSINFTIIKSTNS